MSESSTAPPPPALQRASRTRGTRVAFAAVGALALVLGGSVPAIAAPTAAPPETGPAVEEILSSLDISPQSLGSGTAKLAITGAPTTVEAGTPFPVSLTVHGSLLGAPAPTGEVFIVSLGSGPDGLQFLDTQELAGGEAESVLRPFGLGTKALVAVYSGDETYAATAQFFEPLTVTPVTAVVTVEIDSHSPAYGGGTLGVWVTTESMCESQASDQAVGDLCTSTHGSPDGDVTLKMDGVAVGAQPVVGTSRVGIPEWLTLDASLAEPESRGVFRFDVPVPDRVLGSPESYSFTAEFTPNNWFSAATSETVSVEALAAETSTELVLGALDKPVDTLRVGETVDLFAYVGVEPYWAAPVDGVVNLWLDGEILVEGLALDDGLPTATATLRFDEPGTFSLVAEFVPSTLNHIGSTSTPYTFTVAKPKPDGGTDGDDSNSAKKTVVTQEHLARTGGDSAPLALGAGSLLLAAAGTALLLARRRGVTTQK